MSQYRTFLLGASLLLMLGCLNDAAVPDEGVSKDEGVTKDERARASDKPREDNTGTGVASGPMAMQPDSPIRFDGDTPGDGEKIETLEAAVAAAPDDPALRRRLAIALHGAKRFEEAVEQFERISELRADVRAWMDLGLAYTAASRLPEAEQSYRKLLQLSPGHPVALHNLGNLAFRRRETDAALALYRQALAANPRYLMARFHLADALEEAGMLREAYLAYGSVLELEPGNPTELEAYDDALYGMASLDIKMGEFGRAGEYLSELLAANPNHAKAHYAYGRVLMQLGRAEAAEREFAEHLRVITKLAPETPSGDGN